MKAIISKKENNTPKRTKNSKFKKIMASVSFALCGSFIFAGCAGNTSSVSQDSNYNSTGCNNRISSNNTFPGRA